MNSLYAKLAALLAAAFLAIAGLLVAATHAPVAPDRLLALAADVAIGAVVFALLAALCVFQLFTRRLQRLSAAIEAQRAAGGATPPRLPDADPAGDEVARLAAQFEELGARLAAQSAALERSTRQRSEQLANVAHDLRTPLATMQGYLELLLLQQDRLDGAEARNYLQTAARQSERLGRLVADLFELTRLESDGLRPDTEDFAVAELAHDVAQKFALDAGRRGVRLQACIEPGPLGPPLRVRADIGLAERVLENLVENALRHTPPGGAVTLAAERTPGRATLIVADTGEGIAATELPGIFERYHRAERIGQPTRAGGHGGLGLAIARRIVGLHGGELTVESRPGEGTRVAFDLPLAEPAGAAAVGCAAGTRAGDAAADVGAAADTVPPAPRLVP